MDSLKKTYDCDVIVAGGGIAGVAASLAAARQGAKVILVEKQCILGGLATSGLITIYLPLCDGEGHQVSYGIADELFRLAIKFGAQRKYPKAWLSDGTLEEKKKQRFEVQYNPIYFSLLLEQILREAGVHILYDSLIIDVIAFEASVKNLTVETCEGKIAINAKAFVDATGDARIFYKLNDTTKVYNKKNILAAWYYYHTAERLELNMLGTVEKSDYLDKDRHVDKPLAHERFLGVTNNDINNFLYMAHEQMLQDMINKREIIKGFEPAMIPTMPQFRMTRCLVGEKIMSCLDDGEEFDDSIGIIADWRRRGYIYEIPFGCLKSNKFANIFAAGRCISVDDGMWDISRVIPACAVSGEAAGIAAAIQSANNEVKIEELQKRLKHSGQRIHISEIEL